MQAQESRAPFAFGSGGGVRAPPGGAGQEPRAPSGVIGAWRFLGDGGTGDGGTRDGGTGDGARGGALEEAACASGELNIKQKKAIGDIIK